MRNRKRVAKASLKPGPGASRPPRALSRDQVQKTSPVEHSSAADGKSGSHDAPRQDLTAIKPVVYKGTGELPQLPWQTDFTGTALVIDVWCNVGSTLAALLSLGVHCYAIGLNMVPDVAEMTCKNFQGLVDGGAADAFDTTTLEGIIAKRDFTCIIVGGRPERM